MNPVFSDSEAAAEALHIMEKIFLVYEFRFTQIWAARSSTRRIDRIYQLHTNSYEGFECLPMWEGQGVVGKAFSSRSACFCKDISNLSVEMYSFAPITRKIKISSSFAVCLKSTREGFFYIMEFFLEPCGVESPKNRINTLVAEIRKDIDESRNSLIQKLDDRLFVEVIKVSLDPDELDSFEICATTSPRDPLHDYDLGRTEDSRNNTSIEPTNVLGSRIRSEPQNNQGNTVQQGNTPRELPMGSKARDRSAINTLDIERQITPEVLQLYSTMKLQDVANTLGVSRSTLKRICRKHKIMRWPPMRSNRPNENMNHASIFSANENTDAHTTPNAMTVLDHGRIMVKAVHGEDMLKFQLSTSAKMMDLEQQVTKRLNPSVKSYKIKYLDEENEWVSISCDEDLKLCIGTFRSQGKNTIRMLVD